MVFYHGDVRVTPGTVKANAPVVPNASKTIDTLTITTATSTTLNSVNGDFGASGTAGSVDVFPATASKGKLTFTAANSAGDTTTTITNAPQTTTATLTIPDTNGSAFFVMTAANQTIAGAKTFSSAPAFPQGFCTVDGIAINPVILVRSTITAAILDASSQTGTVTAITGVSGDQYKLIGGYWYSGGTAFGAGGDRTIILSDGTTTFCTLANGDIESLPSTTLVLGDAKLPLSNGNTATASAANVVWKYGTGSSAHTTGSIVIMTIWEKVA